MEFFGKPFFRLCVFCATLDGATMPPRATILGGKQCSLNSLGMPNLCYSKCVGVTADLHVEVCVCMSVFISADLLLATSSGHRLV